MNDGLMDGWMSGWPDIWVKDGEMIRWMDE